MRVLDLDLDFFLRRVSRREPDGRRLDPDAYETWTVREVERYLDDNLALGDGRRPKAHVVEHHRDAFAVLRRLVTSGELEPPFDLVHVDAHADLGMSNDGHRYLMGELLHRSPNHRHHPDDGKLRDANFLIFAAACQWFGNLTYVAHARRYRDGALRYDDRPPCHFRDDNPDSGWLEMRACDPSALTFEPPLVAGYGRSRTPAIRLEPSVAFETIHADMYRTTAPFDIAILALSADYTPPTADALIEVITARLT
jgi:hypothetical protein